MKSRSASLWIVTISLFFAYLLAVVPLPEWAMDWRPLWALMFVFYWTMALPYRIGLGFAWAAGLVLDVLEGGLLGVNALTLLIVAYITLSFHQRLRMYTQLQQSGVVFFLCIVTLALNHWLKVINDQLVSESWGFFLAALSSAAIWPALFLLLRGLRRGFINH